MSSISCEALPEWLPSLLGGELDSARAEALRAHVEQCRSCAETVRAHTALWRGLESWPALPVAARLDQSVRAATLEKVSPWAQPLVQVALALGFGAAACAAGVWALRDAAPLHVFQPTALVLWGALWAAISAFAFLLFLRGDSFESGQELGLRLVGLGGLLSLGLSLGLTRTCTVPELARYCEMQPWARALFGSAAAETTYFVVGALYALVPLFFISFLLGDPFRRRPLLAGALMGAVFLALSVPGIALQCGAFSLGVALSWIAGAAAGSLVGGPAGAVLRRRVLGTSSA